jgi:hypothetical protein
LSTTITRIEFKGYKALGDFILELRGRNILVGPNNSGKSTVIGAFRVLAEGLRVARSRSTEIVALGGFATHCYRIPAEAIAVSTENVHTNYEDVDSSVTFHLSNDRRLILVFPVKGGCFLVPEPFAGYQARSFRMAFPITIAVVPVLGPLEQDESKVKPGTLQRNLQTTRASRHFRNYWHYFPARFEAFSELISETWPNMSVSPPEAGEELIHMFCIEERMTRELFWAGFGFQVWCQLLTHLDRGREDSILVVDEPEIYLHPDLQRKLLTILFSLGPSIVMATHSAEMISGAAPEDITLIDKKALRGRLLYATETTQIALDAIGSSHNVLQKKTKTSGFKSPPKVSKGRTGTPPQKALDDALEEQTNTSSLKFVPIKGLERVRKFYGDDDSDD